MQTTRIENGLMASKNSVFVVFYTKPYAHYRTNEECRSWGADCWNSNIALLGMLCRWDGSFGFAGGKVDGDETLLQAAMRECSEELNYTPDESKLQLVCSHNMVDGSFNQNTHFYACEVTPEEIYNIRNLSCDSIHGQVENAGFNVVHMTSTAPKNLMAYPFAGTAKEELVILLESGIIPEATLLTD